MRFESHINYIIFIIWSLYYIYILDFEKRALRAIGEFQGQYRYPVSFHPGKDVIPLIEVMRVYQEAGGQPTEFVMSHIDRKIHEFF